MLGPTTSWIVELGKCLSISFDKKLWFLFWTERGSNLGVLAHWTSLLIKSTAVLLKDIKKISCEEGFSLPRKGVPPWREPALSDSLPSSPPQPADLSRPTWTGRSRSFWRKKYWFGGINQREKYSRWDTNHCIFLFPMHLPYISTYRKSYNCC